MNIPIEEICEKLDRIVTLLEEKTNEKPSPTTRESKKVLTAEKAAVFLNITKGSLYGLVHKRKIPFSKKGKRLYFLEDDLLKWISDGHFQTISEIEEDARISLNRSNQNLK